VIRLLGLSAILIGFILSEAHAAALRVPGIPSRQQVILVPVYNQIDPTVKLPPPPPPTLGTGALGKPSLPKDVEIEIERDPSAPAPAPVSKPKPTVEAPKPAAPETDEKRKLQADRTRLNHNALMWQLERAQAGSPSAMRSIGMRYLTGDGLEKDESKAREWLKKGADGGDTAAIKELARLDAKPK